MAVDYYEIVDMIAENERAFTYFKEHVSEYLTFYYMNPTDVRPCDVKEKLAELERNPEADLIFYFRTYPEFFFELNKYLLERMIRCEEKSRGDAYRQRALLITEKSIDDISLYDIEDIFFIITNMMREARKEKHERLEEFLLRDLELRLNKEDYRTLRYLCYVGVFNIQFEFEKNRNFSFDFVASIAPVRKEKIYGIYGMALLTHMLMERGEFEEGCVSRGGTD